MADVGNYLRLLLKALPPAVEVHEGGGVLYAVYEISPRASLGRDDRNLLQGAEHCPEVLLLDGRAEVHGLKNLLPTVPEAGFGLIGIDDGGVHFGRLGVEYLFCLRALFADDDRHSGLYDAGLLPGDGLQRVPQQGAVVQADGRNHAHEGCHDVGGIQPSAEAHFQDCEVCVLIGKPF